MEIFLFVLQAGVIFCKLLWWAIVLRIALGYLGIFGIHISIGLLNDLVDPILESIERVIPCQIGWLNFSPIFAFFAIELVKTLFFLGIYHLS